jgi:hypothetical protein
MHAQLSRACTHPQVGDHCSVWYSRGAGIRQGWYDGKIEEVRTRHKDNVSVWFPDGMDRLCFDARGYGVNRNWILQEVADHCDNEACYRP